MWSLGVLLYTLLFSENPFCDVEEILDAKLNIPFPLSSGTWLFSPVNWFNSSSVFSLCDNPFFYICPRPASCVIWTAAARSVSENDSWWATAAVLDQSAHFLGRLQLVRGGICNTKLLWVFFINSTKDGGDFKLFERFWQFALQPVYSAQTKIPLIVLLLFWPFIVKHGAIRTLLFSNRFTNVPRLQPRSVHRTGLVPRSSWGHPPWWGGRRGWQAVDGSPGNRTTKVPLWGLKIDFVGNTVQPKFSLGLMQIEYVE